MGKFILLVLKNLGRNKVRTTLTALAVSVLVTIAALMSTVTRTVRTSVRSSASQTRLIVSEKWVAPSQVPRRYLPQLAALEGVGDWTTWNFYTGFFDESMRGDRAGLGLATRSDNLLEMHADLKGIDPAALEAFKREKTGAIVGPQIMKNMNWKVGQQFTFVSTSHPNKNLRFKIVGISPPGGLSLNFFFRDDYFAEATGDKSSVSLVWLRLRTAAAAESVSDKIQELYSQRQPALKVETESAGVARFAEKGEAILGIIEMVVAILMIDMIVILSNSISISTRERRSEMAVLKVLGFTPVHIMTMVVGEAMLVGGLSGLAGALIAWGSSQLAAGGVLPSEGFAGFLTVFPVSDDTLMWGAVLGALVGFAGSALPAWNAREVKVSDVFSRIA